MAEELNSASEVTAEVTAPDPDEALVSALSGVSDDDSDDNEAERFPGREESDPTGEQYTVKINGVEKSVTHAQLIEHYQKQEAAGQKFEEAAALRKNAEALREQTAQSQQQLQLYINQLDQQFKMLSLEQAPDWESLLNENPHEYLKQKEIQGKRQQAYYQMQQAASYMHQQRQAEEQRELAERMTTESTRMIKEIIPEWADKGLREREETELISWLGTQGYSNDDIQYLNHSRAENIGLARKAMLYDKLVLKAKNLRSNEPEAARPAPTLGGRAKSGGKSIFDDNIAYKDFVKMRNEQIARRRR